MAEEIPVFNFIRKICRARVVLSCATNRAHSLIDWWETDLEDREATLKVTQYRHG